MTRDELRVRWRSGGPSIGAWCTGDSPVAAELVALAGYDWVCVDLQHGAAGFDDLAAIAQAVSVAGAVPLARVPSVDHWVIGRALDLGAAGVVVPLVETPEQAAHAVAASRYPPAGTRSYGPVRNAGTNGESLCVVMCETRAGVESLDAVCAVPGIDGVYVGPRDLALSHGLEPGDALDAVIAGIAQACARHDVPAGIQARSGEDARRWVEAGFRFAAASSERDLLARAAARELAAALGAGQAPLAVPPAGVLRAAARYT